MNKIFFLIFAGTLTLFHHVPRSLASPIIGGTDDTQHNFKYHVSINLRDRDSGALHFICGGSILNNLYILTAAHCFLSQTNGVLHSLWKTEHDELIVIAGTNRIYGPGIRRGVARIFVPNSFVGRIDSAGDIAVLMLDQALGLIHNRDRIRILPPDGTTNLNSYTNKEALIVGHGVSNLSQLQSGGIAETRQVLGVRVLGRIGCPNFERNICVQNFDRNAIRTACVGDSGSPVVFMNIAIGVISRCPENCITRGPIVATRVKPYVPFIVQAMNERGDHTHMHVLIP